jgi:hypothetical protein
MASAAPARRRLLTWPCQVTGWTGRCAGHAATPWTSPPPAPGGCPPWRDTGRVTTAVPPGSARGDHACHPRCGIARRPGPPGAPSRGREEVVCRAACDQCSGTGGRTRRTHRADAHGWRWTSRGVLSDFGSTGTRHQLVSIHAHDMATTTHALGVEVACLSPIKHNTKERVERQRKSGRGNAPDRPALGADLKLRRPQKK